jgi:predicted RNA polymerase sigma factor
VSGEARRAGAQVAERAARDSYGRLVAMVAGRTGDIAAAEDALGHAFAAALARWPEAGVPDRPEAWLLVAARRALGSDRRHGAVRSAAAETLLLLADEAETLVETGFPDERLKLLFVCAHPAIDAGVRTPLMLQTVLGLDAARIAAAFLVAPAAMGQRLVRAKAKIRAAGLRFEEPDAGAMPDRLEAVLGAIYAAYGLAWDATPGADNFAALTEEALFLARLLAELLPDEPEALGVHALLLHCEARADARRVDGAYVPLAEQDPRRWSRPMVAEAEALIRRASAFRRPGRFQTEAAIQSWHVAAAAGRADPRGLAMLYDHLAATAPALGVDVARAAAHGEAWGPAAGLALLDALPSERIVAYQPYWAARAHLLATAGQDAEVAYDRAIGLSQDPAIRAWLAERRRVR